MDNNSTGQCHDAKAISEQGNGDSFKKNQDSTPRVISEIQMIAVASMDQRLHYRFDTREGTKIPGISLKQDNDRATIDYIREGGQAQDLGVPVKSCIVSINNNEVTGVRHFANLWKEARTQSHIVELVVEQPYIQQVRESDILFDSDDTHPANKALYTLKFGSKSEVESAIKHIRTSASSPGRFLTKNDNGCWLEVGYEAAIEKVWDIVSKNRGGDNIETVEKAKENQLECEAKRRHNELGQLESDHDLKRHRPTPNLQMDEFNPIMKKTRQESIQGMETITTDKPAADSRNPPNQINIRTAGSTTPLLQSDTSTTGNMFSASDSMEDEEVNTNQTSRISGVHCITDPSSRKSAIVYDRTSDRNQITKNDPNIQSNNNPNSSSATDKSSANSVYDKDNMTYFGCRVYARWTDGTSQKSTIVYDRNIDRDQVSNSEPNLQSNNNPNSSSATTDKSSVNSEKDKDNRKDVGCRVYARWTDGSYFWGTITKKSIRKGKPRYSVKFEDGDELDSLKWPEVFPVASYRKIFEREPPPPPSNSSSKTNKEEDPSSNVTSLSCDVSDAKDTDVQRKSLQELYLQQCGVCVLCQRAECMKCDSCRINHSNTTMGSKLACLQKICCTFSRSQKAQPAAGFPIGWTFFLGEPGSKSKDSALDRLYLTAPNGRQYRTLKGASAKGHFYQSLSMLLNLEDEFHRQIGVVADIEAAKSPAQSQTSNSKKGMDTKNGIIGVGDRVYCRWPNDFWYWGEVTKKFKKGKMYLYSVLFDDGDFLENLPRSQLATESQVVEEREARRSNEEKFQIVKEFRKSLHDFQDFAQIRNKGKIPGHDDYLSELSLRSWCKEGVPPTIEITDNGEKISDNDISHEGTQERLPYSRRSEEEKQRILEEFKSSPHISHHDFTCAWNEKKKDNLCSATLRYWSDQGEARYEKKKTSDNDISHEENEEKLPYIRRNEAEKWLILEEFKSGPYSKASEFVRAWNKNKGQRDNLCTATFYNWVNNDGIRSKEKSRASSATITTYNTAEGIVRRIRPIDIRRQMVKEYEASGFKNETQFVKFWNRDKTDHDKDYLLDNTMRKYVKQFGASTSETRLMVRDETEPLISRGICEEWTDVNGCNNVAYGTITEFEERDEDEVKSIMFTVKYTDESRALTSTIPEFRELKSKLAWGGCVKFEREQMTSDTLEKKDQTCWHWITPKMRKEELVEALPQLTIVTRGFKLVFSVRDSTIPNAGKGVFVKASTVFVHEGTKSSPFVLNIGELLDLGIYAPFRAEDKKDEHVFALKSFIHSYICEEWSFDTNHADTMFDITDDWTGELHDLARQHIPAYFNECSSSETPTIHAEHDPEGNVHYLLGIGDTDADKLTIPVDGSEMELFIDYGVLYEDVRLRQGYSELPLNEKRKRLKKLEHEDDEYFGDIDDFSGETVADCVAFIEKLVSSETQSLSHTVKQRSLCVLRLLVKKAKTLLNEDADQDGLKSVIVMGESLCMKLATGMDCTDA